MLEWYKVTIIKLNLFGTDIAQYIIPRVPL